MAAVASSIVANNAMKVMVAITMTVLVDGRRIVRACRYILKVFNSLSWRSLSVNTRPDATGLCTVAVLVIRSTAVCEARVFPD
jgi:hypothetical protein